MKFNIKKKRQCGKRNSSETITKAKLVGVLLIANLVLDFLGTRQTVTVPILCSMKEQTVKTNFRGIMSQYNKLRWKASYFILSILGLDIFGITNMKVAKYSIMLETGNILI